jgi:phenylalanyl-tRNA synthetase beta chain
LIIFSTLKPDFVYKALKPKDISFIPLNKDKIFVADELLEYYENNAVKNKFKL